MKQILLDTSYKTMTIACVEDGKVVAFYHKEAFKKQSELAMSVLDDCVKQAGWKPTDIQEIVIGIGPGSYTGVRIAMTIAKTLAAISTIKVKTVTSLEMFVVDNRPTMVLFDARSERAYVGLFKDKQYVKGPMIMSVDEVSSLLLNSTWDIKGDGHLVGGDDSFDMNKTMVLSIISQAKPVDDVDHLKPLYLKEIAAY